MLPLRLRGKPSSCVGVQGQPSSPRFPCLDSALRWSCLGASHTSSPFCSLPGLSALGSFVGLLPTPTLELAGFLPGGPFGLSPWLARVSLLRFGPVSCPFARSVGGPRSPTFGSVPFLHRTRLLSHRSEVKWFRASGF